MSRDAGRGQVRMYCHMQVASIAPASWGKRVAKPGASVSLRRAPAPMSFQGPPTFLPPSHHLHPPSFVVPSTAIPRSWERRSCSLTLSHSFHKTAVMRVAAVALVATTLAAAPGRFTG